MYNVPLTRRPSAHFRAEQKWKEVVEIGISLDQLCFSCDVTLSAVKMASSYTNQFGIILSTVFVLSADCLRDCWPDCGCVKLQESKQTIDALEKERDFYFGKLRDIEVLCQEHENDGIPVLQQIVDILYATEVNRCCLLVSVKYLVH